MDNYEGFKSDVLRLTKIDLSAYKEKQMRRRIDSLVTKHECKSYPEYVKLLTSDKPVFEEFVNFLTIFSHELGKINGSVFNSLLKVCAKF